MHAVVILKSLDILISNFHNFIEMNLNIKFAQSKVTQYWACSTYEFRL